MGSALLTYRFTLTHDRGAASVVGTASAHNPAGKDDGMTEIVEHPELEGIGTYEYGWHDENDAGAAAKRGLSEEVVRDISAKNEWMLELRLKGLKLFERKPMPTWGSDLSESTRQHQVFRPLD